MAQALLKLAPTDFPGQQPVQLQKVLSVKGLGKAYKSQHRVLDDINFDLHVGEFVAVIGQIHLAAYPERHHSFELWRDAAL